MVHRQTRAWPLILVLLAGLSAAAHADVESYQAQLACQTPQTKQLLAAPLKPDPRDNVWVLEVLDAMGVNRECNELSPILFAAFLERSALNGIVHEPIPPLATVAEAIAWEKKVADAPGNDRYEGVTINLDKLRNRALKKSFSLAMWSADDPGLPMVKARPGLTPLMPGVWLPQQAQSSAMGPVIGLVFTNGATQPVAWTAMTFAARHAADSPFDRSFNCFVNGVDDAPMRTLGQAPIPPGGKVVVGCSPSSIGWDIREIDAAWVKRITEQDDQWLLEGPAPEDGSYRYRDTLDKFSSEQSHKQAAPIIESLSCEQRLGCIGPKLERAARLESRMAVVAMPSVVAGGLLLAAFSLGRRRRMRRVAPKLIGLTVVLGIAALAWLLISGQRLGMGAILVSYWILAATAGAIIGIVGVAVVLGQGEAAR